MPIPFEAIDRYAQRFPTRDPEGFERFLTLIEAMDNAWLERVRQRND